MSPSETPVPGQRVTLNLNGVHYMYNAAIPNMVRAIYGIIYKSGGTIISISGDIAWVAVSPEKYPHYKKVGVLLEYLQRKYP